MDACCCAWRLVVSSLLSWQGANHMISDLSGNVLTLEATIRNLEATNKDLEATIKDLKGTIKKLEATIKDLEATNKDLEATNKDLEATNKNLEATNKNLEAQLMAAQAKIAELKEVQLHMVVQFKEETDRVRREAEAKYAQLMVQIERITGEKVQPVVVQPMVCMGIRHGRCRSWWKIISQWR